MTHTDKQPQTVYVEVSYFNGTFAVSTYNSKFYIQKIENVLLITPAELEAMKAEWQREAAAKAMKWTIENCKINIRPRPIRDSNVIIEIDEKKYFNTHHPIK